MQIFVQNLQLIQPLVQIMPAIGEATLVLIEEALEMWPPMMTKIKSNTGGLLALTAAAFWVLAKFGGMRASTPNSILMARASQVKEKHLHDMEMMLLTAVSWDVAGIIRRNGLSNTVG